MMLAGAAGATLVWPRGDNGRTVTPRASDRRRQVGGGRMRRILVTGGAGFIGSHLADLLLEQGYSVRVLDSLSPQVHGDDEVRPAYLAPEVELVRGDIRDPLAARRALEGVDAVVHLAAAVGVGQSMYRIADYVGINDLGTAVLLEALMAHPVERLIVASSMSVYGEGLGRTRDGRLIEPAERDRTDGHPCAS